MSFYNTTGLSSDQLRDAIAACNRQEMNVLKLYRKHVTLSPSEAHKLYGEDVPLTSIRRAITDLTERGLLVKSATMRRGAYGKPEHCWTLATGEPQAAASAEPQNFSPVSVPTEPTSDRKQVLPVGAGGEAREGTPKMGQSTKSTEPDSVRNGHPRGGRDNFTGELFANTPANAGTY